MLPFIMILLDVAFSGIWLVVNTWTQVERLFHQILTLLFLLQTPRVCQTAIMSAMFFTLFEFWKAQLKPHQHRASRDRLLEPKIWHKRRDHVWKRQFVQN